MYEICTVLGGMVEVQQHGFSFERWVRHTVFSGYEGNYMQKWDVPPHENRNPAIDSHLRGIAVSIKTAKIGSPIGLGDIIRQRSTSEPFLMIAGFWSQRTPTEKWFESIGAARFSVEDWSSLWGSLTLADLNELDAIVKDMSTNYRIVRQEAQAWKKKYFDGSGSKIVINPKIDSKKQRRVQCSLPFSVFWQFVGDHPTRADKPQLFGFAFENPVVSSARKFNRD